MKPKGLKVLALSLTTVMIFSGCGAVLPTDDKIKIKVAFWGTPEEITIIKNSVQDWQEAHPGIEILYEHSPYPGYDSKILTRIAGGAAPDIIATEVDYFVTFASKGVLENLTPYAEQDPEFSTEDFFPSIIKRFTVDGELLIIPRDVAPYACVFYNKRLFDEANVSYPDDDWTWEDLLKKARDLTKVDEKGRTVQYGFYGWAWQNFIYGNGGAMVDDVNHPTRTLVDEPKAIEGIQFYSDLVNLYKVMPSFVALQNLGMGVDRMFASGRLAMFLSGIWETPGLRKYDFEWDVAMFPKNAKGIRAFESGGTGYGILKTCRHKKEAWEVIKALTGPVGQAELARRGLTQPSRIAVAESEAWAKNTDPPANKKMLNDATKHIVFSPFHPGWREIKEKYLIPKLDLVWDGKRTAAEVLKEIAPKINAVLRARQT